MARGPEGWVDRAFPAYFVFGEHASGCVDLADTSRDTIAAAITKDEAQALIDDREAMREALIRFLVEHPDSIGLLYER